MLLLWNQWFALLSIKNSWHLGCMSGSISKYLQKVQIPLVSHNYVPQFLVCELEPPYLMRMV